MSLDSRNVPIAEPGASPVDGVVTPVVEGIRLEDAPYLGLR
jgi:hypothetical protein